MDCGSATDHLTRWDKSCWMNSAIALLIRWRFSSTSSAGSNRAHFVIDRNLAFGEWPTVFATPR